MYAKASKVTLGCKAIKIELNSIYVGLVYSIKINMHAYVHCTTELESVEYISILVALQLGIILLSCTLNCILNVSYTYHAGLL